LLEVRGDAHTGFDFSMFMSTSLMLLATLAGLLREDNCSQQLQIAVRNVLCQLCEIMCSDFTIPILRGIRVPVQSSTLRGDIIAGLLHHAGLLSEWVRIMPMRLDGDGVQLGNFLFFLFRKCGDSSISRSMCTRALHTAAQQLEAHVGPHLSETLTVSDAPKEVKAIWRRAAQS
jgi:hypothetical protein